MSLVREGNELWFEERLYSDISQRIKVDEVVARVVSRDVKKKKIHELLVLNTPRYGKVLVLNDVIQTTEADEAYYHEPLVHCAYFSCAEKPKAALLIGCDGGTLREARKHTSLKKIDIVDIDRTVIQLVKSHMPTIAENSWDDPRVRLTIADGARFVARRVREKKKYDLIIIDSPDPKGPARSLFRSDFYSNVARILSPHGVVVRQTGSSQLQPDEMPSHYRQMLEIFHSGDVQGFRTAVPTYIGGYFTFVAASLERGLFAKAQKTLARRFRESDIATLKLKWYSPEMHRAAIALPPELAEALEQSEYGRELILDLYGCDYAQVSSSEKIKKFAGEICRVIRMKPYGEPIVPDFGFAQSKTAGPSLVQLIETSAITAHYSPHWRLAVENIFTCATLDAERAVAFSMEYFGADKAVWELRVRGRRFMKLNSEHVEHVTEKKRKTYETRRVVYRRVS